MTRIDRVTFCKTYVPMAKAGKSALEIGRALGIEKDTDEAISQFVSQKASNYRKELREAAVVAAQKQGLTGDEADAFVQAAVDKLPKLKTRTRQTEDFVSFLDELLAECDEENEATPE